MNNLSIYQTGKDNKKSIVFIHGFPFDHFTWDKQVDELKSSYHCITYDLRGLGNSLAGDGQYTIEGFVDDLFNLINELELVKPVVCGLSMGGYIALRAIERDQEKFGGLILCDTKSEADTNESKIARADAIKNITLNGVKAFVEAFVPKCFTEKFPISSKTEYEGVLNRAINSDQKGVTGCLLAMAARTDTTSYLPKIKFPVLLICGNEDKITPPDVMMAMAGKIPKSEFILIPDAGHLSSVEKPGIFNNALKKFLARN